MFRFLGSAVLFLAGMALVVPASAQKTDTKFDDTYDFSRHKRYQWRENRLMTRQNPDTNELMDLKIVKAVNQFLASKGFVEVKEKPDFLLSYDGGGNSQVGAGGATQAALVQPPLRIFRRTTDSATVRR